MTLQGPASVHLESLFHIFPLNVSTHFFFLFFFCGFFFFPLTHTECTDRICMEELRADLFRMADQYISISFL